MDYRRNTKSPEQTTDYTVNLHILVANTIDYNTWNNILKMCIRDRHNIYKPNKHKEDKQVRYFT